MYTTQCKLESESVVALMYAAKKYQIVELERRCIEFLKNEISVDNVCCFLTDSSRICPDEEFEKKCLQFIMKHSSDVIESAGFCSLSKECLRKILQSDGMSAPEIDIYKACKRWALETIRQEGNYELDNLCIESKGNEELRKTLGDLVYLIRFTNIPKEMFSSTVAKENILSPEEKVEIFQYMVDKPFETPQGFRFNTESRRDVISNKVIKRFNYDANGPFVIRKGEQHGINFKISSGIVKLAGISIFRSYGHGKPCQGKITVLAGEQELLIMDGICINPSDGKNYIYTEEVLFDRPHRIKPDVIYSVILIIMADCHSYFGSQQRRDIAEGHDIETGVNIQFFDCPKSTGNRTNTEVGQIDGLIVKVLD
jgi:hypothetical protein